MKERDRRYTANGLAKAVGCTRKALRVYQAAGLVPKVDNTWKATYDAHVVDRLRLVVTLRQLDLPIEQIAEVLGVRDRKQGGAESALPLALALRDIVNRVTERIDLLQRIRGDLIRAREELFGCAACQQPATECVVCIDAKVLDPVTRVLLGGSPPADAGADQDEPVASPVRKVSALGRTR